MALTVAHLFPDLQHAGAERFVTDLMCAADPARVRPIGVALHSRRGNALEAQLEQAGVPLWFLDKGVGLDPRTLRKVWRAFGAERPHVVHTHSHTLFYALPAMLRFGTAGVHTMHTVAEHDGDDRVRAVNRLGFRLGVVPVAISESVAHSAVAAYGGARPLVIRNGIPIGRFTAGRERSRAALGLPPTARVVACVARLAPEKDHAGLLRALATLPDVIALFAGAGPEEGALRSLAATLALGDRVRFLGPVDDVPAVLAASDVFVLNSVFEGLGLAAMEAQAAGLPVVATRTGGLPEVVVDGTGLLVPPGDPAALGAALRRLFDEPETRAAMGAAARRVAAGYDIGAMARAYEDVYERAPRLGRLRARRAAHRRG